LGSVDAAMEASLAADAAEAAVDAQWLARVPVGPRDPNAVQIPTANIPADPNPRIFNAPTALRNYQLYRRLIPGFVYFNHWNDRERGGREHPRVALSPPAASWFASATTVPASCTRPRSRMCRFLGSYRIEPKSVERDILHRYADNGVFIETDRGEQLAMTLEDGRRHLFWDKDYMILSEWAAEQKPVPCQLPADPDPSLMNTGISLATTIAPDEIGELEAMPITLTRAVSGLQRRLRVAPRSWWWKRNGLALRSRTRCRRATFGRSVCL
jgi:hypothetical protein